MIHSFPKIELHCHLDGSLRPKTVFDLAENYGISHPYATVEAMAEALIAPVDCDSLDTYLKRFELPISVLQTQDALLRASFELMEDAALENVKYIEIRFAPQLHTAKGLSLGEIIESVITGIRKAEFMYDIRGNVILSYLRNTSVEGLYEVIDAGKPFLNNGVVAVDLCGGERDRFSERFEAPIQYARQLGYHVTIHAGETGIAENMKDAVNLLNAERIGHGVAMALDAETFDLIKSNGVFLECCPTSNVQTKAVEVISEHPLDQFYSKDVRVTINTDNRTVSNTTMASEYDVLETHFSWNSSHWKKIYEMSIEAAFADNATKEFLKEKLNQWDVN